MWVLVPRPRHVASAAVLALTPASLAARVLRRAAGSGRPAALPADADTRPWLLLAWASWSPASRNALPVWDALAQRYQSAVRLATLDLGRWPDAADAVGVPLSAARPTAVPAALLVGADGAVLRRLPDDGAPAFVGMDVQGVARWFDLDRRLVAR
jgi:thioredoxin-like negative regulator of GroEL